MTTPEMQPETVPAATSRGRISAIVAIIAVCVVAAWLVALRMQGTDAATPGITPSATGVQASGPAIATAQDVLDAATAVGHAVYWAGEREGTQLELTVGADGSVFVRYLPTGVEAGVEAPYLTVATYPDANAYGNLTEAAKQPGAASVKYAGGALAVAASETATNVNFGFEDAGIQIEVFSPAPGEAWDLIDAGAVVQAL